MSRRLLSTFALCCLGMLVPVAHGQKAPELGRIPAKAGAAIHIRAGSIYAHPSMKDLRDFVAKAGPRAMETLNQRFQLTPFQLDRITAVVMVPDLGNPGNAEPPFAVMITTLVDVDADSFAQRLEIKGKKVADAGYPAWVEGPMALAFPEPRLIIFGEKKITEMLAKGKSGAAPAGFTDLETHDVTLIANLKALPEQMAQFLPEPFGSLAKAETIKATLDINSKTTLALDVQYPNERDAVVAEDAIKDLARKALVEMEKPRKEMLKSLENPGKPRPSSYQELPEALGGLLGLSMMNQMEELLKDPPLKRNGSKMAAKIEMEGGPYQLMGGVGAVGIGLALPAVQKVRAAAQRSQSTNNLKQIALAFHNYESANGHFPSDIVDKKTGKPLLSWRVAFLPYLEQNALYQQFKLDEPWDSENNLKLSKMVVKVYALPQANAELDSNGHFITYYQAIKGKGTMFEPGKKLKFADVTDGTSNTIMFVEAKKGVIWTKPEDVDFDETKDLPPVGTLFGAPAMPGFNAAFGDGSVRFISNMIDPVTLKALFTRAGGEVINNH